MRINRREKALLSLGGILVFVLLYYLFIVSPTISRQGVLEKYILKKEADLVKMVELNLKWDSFKNNKANAEKI
ncbi:MAG: type II secretion system protein GspM, partial [Candidatus Hydrothermarchaeales archaeon]